MTARPPSGQVVQAVLYPPGVKLIGPRLAPYPTRIFRSAVQVRVPTARRGHGDNPVSAQFREMITAEHVTQGDVSMHIVDGHIQLG
ncbi:MAG TPA: hypothetical protein VGH53_15555 [Streptosporangiaceae bacterium]|jgi:hypothetical protein